MIGILSDAHGSLGAFRAAILHLRGLGAKSFYFLGDAVGYIPSLDVVEELRSMRTEVKCVLGNHEQMLLQGSTAPEREPIYQHQPLRERLSNNQIHFLQSWPTHYREIIAGTSVLFVHGSPRDYTSDYVYPDTDLDQFHACDSFVFMGHSHYPFVRCANGTTFVNVGSCGLPRDDGRYGAFATFDPAAKSVRIYRYAIDKFVGKIDARTLKSIHPAVLQLFERRASHIAETIFNDIKGYNSC